MVKEIITRSLKNSSNLLFKQQSSILSGAVVISLMLLASAVLGLVKKRLYASIITPGPELDVFFAAFKLPDITFQLLVGGALNAAFIPVFSDLIAHKDNKESWSFVSNILNTVTVFSTILGVIFFIFAPKLTFLVGVGFTPEENIILVNIIRILILAPIILGISSFIAGTLQSFKRFFLPFLSPVIYNLGAIFGVVVLYPFWGIYGAAIGVLIGAVGHFVIQIPALLHLGFRYKFNLDLTDVSLRKVVKLSIPRAIGSGVEQIKQLMYINLGSVLPRGSISFFDLGQSIAMLPVSIIGVSFSQASLPEMASLYARKDYTKLASTFLSTFNQILFFTVPVCVALIVLKIPVVRLVYGAGNFSWDDTVLTAWVMAAFAIGVVFQAVNNLLIRLFFAMHETKLPVYIGIISIVVGLLSALAIVIYYPGLGIKGLATTISVASIIEFVLLIGFIVRKKIITLGELITTPLRIGIASVITAFSIYIPVKYLDTVFLDTTRVVNLVILVWLVLCFGAVTYLVSTWVLGVKELKVILKILIRVDEFRKNLENSFRTLPTMGVTSVDDDPKEI